MIRVKVTKKESNQRVDKYVKKYLNEAPLSFIYKLFRKKDVKINGHWVKQDHIVKEDEELTIYVSDAQLEEFNKPKDVTKRDLKYPIVYEDSNILIVNKPRGVLVHGDNKEKRNTLSNDVLNYLYYKGEYNPREAHAFSPAPAHRLDRNTSGLVLFAKNLDSLNELEELFKEKEELVKTYVALVYGKVNDTLKIDLPLIKDSNSGLVKVGKIKDGAKSALSIVTPLKHYGNFTLVSVNLITGRTHQIRVHLSAVNYPIVGDSKYGNFEINRYIREEYKFENQFLHAKSIEFKNIKKPLDYLSGKTFTSNLPKDMEVLLNKLR